MQALEKILSSLTPDYVRQVILEIAREQEPTERPGVGVGSIVNRLFEEHGIGMGRERARAYLKLVRVIEDKAALVEGMKYVSVLG